MKCLRILLIFIILHCKALPVDERKERIITLGSSVTETVFALGAGADVVAIDQSSYNRETSSLPNVGYYRAISAEGVLSMKPTLIMASAHTGPPAALTQLQQSKIPFLLIPEEYSMDGVRKKISIIAEAMHQQDAGQTLLSSFDQSVAYAKKTLKDLHLETKPRVLFIMSFQGGSFRSAGMNTGAASMIELAGGVNALSEFESYRSLTSEGVIKVNPDIVLFPSFRLTDALTIESLTQAPGLRQTSAVKSEKVYAIDIKKIFGYGPDAAEGLHDLIKLIHANKS
ncbi:MAG: ABC transporter substrate-binding protein [Verrucomicrobiota bacterium]